MPWPAGCVSRDSDTLVMNIIKGCTSGELFYILRESSKMASTTLLEAKNTLGDPLVLDSTPKDDHLEDQFNRDRGNESGDQDRLKPKLFTTREISPRGHVTNSDPEISEPKEHSFSFQSVGMW